ncbi:hypothetical protein [Vibrio parahaemolyticus]|uniref:hypothetical protein n=2 Tax=Vibrio parahaemolyticus TaxID=670 RepID=UPI001EDAFBFA|nr:hypothetical protein [Vibrio parahaemolyticus]
MICNSISLQEHALNTLPVGTGASQQPYLVKIGGIKIVNMSSRGWQLAPTLEELESELQQVAPLNPASAYVRLALKTKVAQNSKLKNLETQIETKALQHEDIRQRDKSPHPLTTYEQKHFKSLLERIIGGCIVQAPYLPAIEKTKEFAKSIYAHLDVQVGAVINFIQGHCQSSVFKGMPKLSHNTLRKVISELAPKSAFRRGRSTLSDIEKLKAVTQEIFGREALLI